MSPRVTKAAVEDVRGELEGLRDMIKLLEKSRDDHAKQTGRSGHYGIQLLPNHEGICFNCLIEYLRMAESWLVEKARALKTS